MVAVLLVLLVMTLILMVNIYYKFQVDVLSSFQIMCQEYVLVNAKLSEIGAQLEKYW
jgi:hypothetical protein